ncbi:hypothetical protein [Thiocystis violacea]|uniref:hypothetical protein n=1 Tax=Thiocystis violacea TaxID=13725 RepID=UPI0019084DAD|nr:hypothetical protein [Thiocystis violacea]MBK1716874.1 hypothetical protein [Thiocystis violacea]
MDNDAFRETYRAVNELFCPYEKSLLTNNAGCSLARKFCIAEREGVQCGSAAAQSTCLELLDLLRRQARFALKSTDASAALPHAKAMRIQVGGLRGIQASLTPDEPVPGFIEDINATVSEAVSRFGALEDLPFAAILREIATFRGRRRTDRRQ